MLVYLRMILLDLTGPLTVTNLLRADVDFYWEDRSPLMTEETRHVQLTLEYSPQPPYRNGTPEEAGLQRMDDARKRLSWMDDRARVAAVAARSRPGLG